MNEVQKPASDERTIIAFLDDPDRDRASRNHRSSAATRELLAKLKAGTKLTHDMIDRTFARFGL